VTLVVDASVAAKWVLPEAGSAEAAALRTQDSDLIAPSLVVAEIGNALWKSAMRGDLAGQDVTHILNIGVGHYARLIPIAEIAAAAMEIAVDLKHPIYDCFYLALAERERCALMTADARLRAAAKRRKKIEVRAL
jgi:predicted nucleic acid-binding protein